MLRLIPPTADALPSEVYLPPEDRLISGQPWQRVWPCFEASDGRFLTGVWESEPGHWRVEYTEQEYCEILSGVSLLHDAEGRTHRLVAGDRFVIPSGFTGSWEVLETTRKVYVISVPPA